MGIFIINLLPLNLLSLGIVSEKTYKLSLEIVWNVLRPRGIVQSGTKLSTCKIFVNGHFHFRLL